MKSLSLQLALLALLAALLAVGSCKRAPGPVFAGPDATPPGSADLYLYRRHAYAAIGDAFAVTVDGRRVGALYNASFLRLSLAPGMHAIQIAPGGTARPVAASVAVDAGKRAFYEFRFATGWDMRPSFPGAALAPRAEAAALGDLSTLRSAY
jgi:hypothetical protein